MHLVKIDRLDAQTFERRIQRPMQMRAGRAGIVYVPTCSEPRFGRDDKAAGGVGTSSPPASGQFFRSATALDVGRVDHIAASLEESVEDGKRFLLGRLGPDPHRSQDQVRDRQARTS